MRVPVKGGEVEGRKVMLLPTAILKFFTAKSLRLGREQIRVEIWGHENEYTARTAWGDFESQ